MHYLRPAVIWRRSTLVFALSPAVTQCLIVCRESCQLCTYCLHSPNSISLPWEGTYCILGLRLAFHYLRPARKACSTHNTWSCVVLWTHWAEPSATNPRLQVERPGTLQLCFGLFWVCLRKMTEVIKVVAITRGKVVWYIRAYTVYLRARLKLDPFRLLQDLMGRPG